MKAWRVDCGDKWCCLVMATTRSRAKMVFCHSGPAIEYIHVRAIRRPELDGLVDHEKLYDSPDDLPDGVTFWSPEAEEDWRLF